jgi:type II secretory pathway pseudopilin PulG
MIEPLSIKIYLKRTIRLPKTRPVNQIFKVGSSQTQEMGSSLIELLLATALALIAASSAAQIMSELYDRGLNRRAAATSAIEVAISNDLAWFRQYAMLWRLQKGPFDANALSNSVTHTPTAYTQDTPNQYTPIACNSPDMATTFRDNAANTNTHVSPINSPPQPFISNELSQSIALPVVASKYKLSRKLEPGLVPGTLKITYTLTDPDVVTTFFTRSSSLYLPAAGWC